MNVLYTCDNNYIWLMGISAISMFENNKEIDNLHVYLLGENISDENKKVLKEIECKYSRVITVIDVPRIDIPEVLVSARWPLSAFTRLYAGDLLPTYIEKVLYLDCDTIIKGDISELERWNAEGKVFWGIKDCIGKEYKKNIGISADGLYVNAGVLLMNLPELRKIDIKQKLNAYMAKYQRLINYADQDVLNGAFSGSIGVLPPQYDVMTIAATYSYRDIQKLRRPTNYYSEEEIRGAVADPVLIHYTTNMLTVRPWFSNTNHPFAGEFRKYKRISYWKDRQLSEMVFDSREAKIIAVIEKLPSRIKLFILGWMHAIVKPLAIKIKAEKRANNK